METFYMLLFGFQALLAAVFEYGNRIGNDNKHAGASNEFLAFRNNYLIVYSLMTGKNPLLWTSVLKYFVWALLSRPAQLLTFFLPHDSSSSFSLC